MVSLPPLADFVSLIEETDPDAAFRLSWFPQAVPALYENASVPGERRENIADRLERWRFQLLNKNAPDLSPRQQRLAEVLDVAASVVRGRPRPPKCPRQALAAQNREVVEAAAAAFDPQRPLAEMVSAASELTLGHFAEAGALAPQRRMLLYAPLYLSSFCINHCHYCSFRFPQELEREHLSTETALAQAAILRQRGFRHLLLVAGDFPRLTSPDYFTPIITALVERGFSVAIEIAPQSTLAYSKLARAGVCGVTLYQETYQEELYNRYHPLGPKTWYDWRLEGPERAAEAGMKRLGLGILLGLADPRHDLGNLIAHGRYLGERFPHIRLAFSLPRIHDAPSGFQPACQIDDDTFIRIYCALRLAFPTADLVLSTREGPELRDRLAGICITQMSAGSSTSPGGYDADAADPSNRQQFPVFDQRSPAEVADALGRAGFKVHWSLIK